jgi:ribosomal protein S21|tara:strand:+ start:498 stop:734 length:237 start_codon:yes stop_codon:yes gene_type:complete
MSKHLKTDTTFSKGFKVDVYNNDIAKALRKLKKKLADDGLFQEMKQREFYQSKGTKRRLSKLASIRRAKKLQQKSDEI